MPPHSVRLIRVRNPAKVTALIHKMLTLLLPAVYFSRKPTCGPAAGLAANRYHQNSWETHMPRNFAIRLRCPNGDADSWVTLSNREESLEQILQQTWEFKCREHGLQQGIPQEAMEVAPIDDPQSSQNAPPSLAIPFPATPEKKIPRSGERIPMRVPVSHSQEQRSGAGGPRRLPRPLLRPRNSRRLGLQTTDLQLLEKKSQEPSHSQNSPRHRQRH